MPRNASHVSDVEAHWATCHEVLKSSFSNQSRLVAQHACQQHTSLSQGTGLLSYGCWLHRARAPKYQQRDRMAYVGAELGRKGGEGTLVVKNTACGRNEEKSNREKLSQQQPGKTHRANTFLKMLFFHWKEPELLLGAKKLQNKLRISYLVPESKEVITEWWGHVTKTQNQTKWLLLAKHSTIWGSK